MKRNRQIAYGVPNSFSKPNYPFHVLGVPREDGRALELSAEPFPLPYPNALVPRARREKATARVKRARLGLVLVALQVRNLLKLRSGINMNLVIAIDGPTRNYSVDRNRSVKGRSGKTAPARVKPKTPERSPAITGAPKTHTHHKHAIKKKKKRTKRIFGGEVQEENKK
jgi:hypothetical protein